MGESSISPGSKHLISLEKVVCVCVYEVNRDQAVGSVFKEGIRII